MKGGRLCEAWVTHQDKSCHSRDYLIIIIVRELKGMYSMNQKMRIDRIDFKLFFFINLYVIVRVSPGLPDKVTCSMSNFIRKKRNMYNFQ